MDLEYLIQNYKNRPPGIAICLSIVQQNDMPHRYKDVYRCGAAGIKEAFDFDRPYGSAGGNLISRMASYLNTCRREPHLEDGELLEHMDQWRKDLRLPHCPTKPVPGIQ